MSKQSILVVEDDINIQELVRHHLEQQDYTVLCEDDGNKALVRMKSKAPDMVILDLMLPGVDGLTVCREMRYSKDLKHIPVIMLTAKSDESDVLVGLEVGASDYITKPFSPRVLTARVRTLLTQRDRSQDSDIKRRVVRGPLDIDSQKYRALLKGKELTLTLTEFNLLYLLASRPGIVFSRYQIVDSLRGSEYPVTDRSVDVQIVGLRKKLGKHSNLVETVRGVGYRFLMI